MVMESMNLYGEAMLKLLEWVSGMMKRALIILMELLIQIIWLFVLREVMDSDQIDKFLELKVNKVNKVHKVNKV
jgi:hypothetical protein